mmetsp:Transcript_48869/g.72944  ORF Transcript_48869/g.72944 Transcript_48869/m.72944 type:complete len:142 (+) Transcript_48869:1436-1861(+)
MHGITFGCMWVASVDFAAVVSPREWATTFQTILTAFLSCLGAGSGPILGGWVVAQFGFVVLWRLAAGIVAGLAVVHGAMMLCGMGHDAFLKSVKAELPNRSIDDPPAMVDSNQGVADNANEEELACEPLLGCDPNSCRQDE